MAKIELRHATIRLKDGFSATAAVNDMSITAGDTTLSINTVVANGPLGSNVIPVGSRFTFSADPGVYRTVTARTPSNGLAATTAITFTPALTTLLLPSNSAVLTFSSIRLTIKVGDGNLTYTEKRNMSYELDRGVLDTVKEGDDAPVELKMSFVYEFVTTGTSESTTPADAIKRVNAASEWTSSSSDLCEPYAVDVEVEYIPPCTANGTQKETTVFPDFRYEQLAFDLKAASISVDGKCNARQPAVTRG